MIRLLVVDDDMLHCRNVCDYCELRDWSADCAGSVMQAEEMLATRTYDLILLDVSMPGEDGVSFCRRLRLKDKKIPILFVTGSDDIASKVTGLTSGADDYITKPFDFQELGARIEAALRRVSPTVLQVADLVFDTVTLTVTRAGIPLNLSSSSLKILRELMRVSPALVSRERLERILWGGELPDSDCLRSCLYQLRQCVDKPFAVKLIHTKQGLGWALFEDGGPAS